MAVGLAVAASVAACGGEEPPPAKPIHVDWDLSGAHTRAQVTWPRDQWDAYTARLMPVESARIRLPEGKLLDIPAGLHDIGLYRRAQGPEPLPGPEGEILEKVEVYSEPLEVEQAYRRALEHVRLLEVPEWPIHTWRRRRERGFEELTDRTTATNLDRRLGGKDGLYPAVEMLYSADPAKPWKVMISLYWEPPEGS